jgi:hypothetical protein
MRDLVAAGTCLALLLCTASPALARRPHGTPPGQLKKAQGGPPSAPAPSGQPDSGTPGVNLSIAGVPSAGVPTAARVRTLGVWLDDASTFTPGEAWLTVSAQRWTSPIATGFDAPVFDLAVGVAPRLHVSASIPYSRSTVLEDPQAPGLGDLYIGAKYVLRDAALGGVGVAVGPTFEILSRTSAEAAGLGRVNAILPVSLEWRQKAGRIYGTTGYFTRGIFFGGGAVERYLTDRWVVVGALTYARSTDEEALGEEIGLRPWRADATGSLAFIVSPSLMLFGSLTRTLSDLDADSTRYAFSAGASFNLNAPRTRPIVP